MSSAAARRWRTSRPDPRRLLAHRCSTGWSSCRCAAAMLAGRETAARPALEELQGFWRTRRSRTGRAGGTARAVPWFRFRLERADGRHLAGRLRQTDHRCRRQLRRVLRAVRDISEAESTIHALRRDEERFPRMARLVTSVWRRRQPAYTLVGAVPSSTSADRDMIGKPFGSRDWAGRRVRPPAAITAMERREPLQRLPLRVRYADRPDRVSKSRPSDVRGDVSSVTAACRSTSPSARR